MFKNCCLFRLLPIPRQQWAVCHIGHQRAEVGQKVMTYSHLNFVETLTAISAISGYEEGVAAVEWVAAVAWVAAEEWENAQLLDHPVQI